MIGEVGIPSPGSIGRRIRAARKARGLTQHGLARQAGISQSQVSRLEADRALSGLKAGCLVAIARALGIAPTRLAAGTKVEGLVVGPKADTEDRLAFCPNPLCQTNTVECREGRLHLFWTSGRSYDEPGWRHVRYCAFCGETLVKACRDCGWRIRSANDRICARCGQPLHHRPTPAEWETLRKRHSPGEGPRGYA